MINKLITISTYQCPLASAARDLLCRYRALAYCSMVPPEYISALADLELSYNLSENKFKAMLQVRVALWLGRLLSANFLILAPHFSSQRGYVKRRVGRPEEAIDDLKRAVSLDAKNREAHNHLGMALLDAGFLDQVPWPIVARRSVRAT
jgi:hypothetical protein